MEPLIARLGDRASSVRQAAADALSWLGEGRFAQAVLGALAGQAEARQELARLAQKGDARAVEPLIARLGDRASSVRQAAANALEAIYKALAPRWGQFLCRSDWTRFERRTAWVGHLTVPFLACRVCGRTADAWLDVHQVVAVLDQEMEEEVDYANGTVRGNWLKRDKLFDFDRVEIVHASDYEVERFCIQVGNDTDSFRKGRYREMCCTVARQCSLSEATMSMLRDRFGRVVVAKVV